LDVGGAVGDTAVSLVPTRRETSTATSHRSQHLER
jgi:hypothetical protein